MGRGAGVVPLSLGEFARRHVNSPLPAREDCCATRKAFAERLVAVSFCVDLVVVFACLAFAFWLRFETGLADFGVVPEGVNFAAYLPYILMGGFSVVAALAYYRVYDVLKLLRLRQVGFDVVKALVSWLIVFLSFTLILKFEPPISRVYVGLASGVTLFGIIGWRYVFHRTLQNGRASSKLRQRILFIGWNADSARLSASVTGGPHASHSVAGFVRAGASSVSAPGDDVPELGSLRDVPHILQVHQIDVVILSAFDLKNEEVVWLASLCEQEMRQFKVIPSFFPILVSGLRLETISRVPVLGITQLPLDFAHNRAIKRALDIVVGALATLLSMPIIALFSALVALECGGPTIYWQWRSGKDGRRFRIYKIRSMHIDAESEGVPQWTREADPRCLRVGAFMRRWNIDELPQFWNVLKGDMSLVGPRPERPELIHTFKSAIPHYNARHNVKAGLTGWAQVKGFRGDTDLNERIKCDLFYMENWNLLLDLQILVMTPFARTNAY
jgi:exopolysaccharide biosynthesis polyprenyl glycosylphosphotransferase